jgi:hypothetical protein
MLLASVRPLFPFNQTPSPLFQCDLVITMALHTRHPIPPRKPVIAARTPDIRTLRVLHGGGVVVFEDDYEH